MSRVRVLFQEESVDSSWRHCPSVSSSVPRMTVLFQEESVDSSWRLSPSVCSSVSRITALFQEESVDSSWRLRPGVCSSVSRVRAKLYFERQLNHGTQDRYDVQVQPRKLSGATAGIQGKTRS